MGRGGLDGLKPALSAEDAWIGKFDHEAFKSEVRALGKTLLDSQGTEDLNHLQRITFASNLFAFAGLSTMWVQDSFWISLFSVVCLSTWTFSRWTMIGHHVCHGGYDKVDPSKRYNRFTFAVNGLAKRLSDWFDWMLPEAWNVEHNNMHHYSLGEMHDPDLVEENLRELRESTMPLPLKYAQVFATMFIWKWIYYAPNTYKELKLARMRREGKSPPRGMPPVEQSITLLAWLGDGPVWFSLWEFFVNVAGPYLVLHFFVLPAPLLWLGGTDVATGGTGWAMFGTALRNLVLAELLTNVHSFAVIANNHAGEDLYRFDSGVKPRSGTFYTRQVVSSVNFPTGNPLTGASTGFLADCNDFVHGWLNFQIEHHLWPNASMLTYQKAAPLVKALCAKHGVPYVQQSALLRLHKCVQIMTGVNSMRQFPTDYGTDMPALPTTRGRHRCCCRCCHRAKLTCYELVLASQTLHCSELTSFVFF